MYTVKHVNGSVYKKKTLLGAITSVFNRSNPELIYNYFFCGYEIPKFEYEGVPYWYNHVVKRLSREYRFNVDIYKRDKNDLFFWNKPCVRAYCNYLYIVFDEKGKFVSPDRLYEEYTKHYKNISWNRKKRNTASYNHYCSGAYAGDRHFHSKLKQSYWVDSILDEFKDEGIRFKRIGVVLGDPWEDDYCKKGSKSWKDQTKCRKQYQKYNK